MGGKQGRASLEDILTEVENDATLATGKVEPRQATGDGRGASVGDGAMGEGLGALLSHPELLSRLPVLLRAVQSLTETPHLADEPPHTPEALLCALRPYLNEPRRCALDTMIRITRLSDALGSAGK